jgi:mRNA interferase MazF
VDQQSVVNVSQLVTLDKRDLWQRVGTLDPERMRDVLEGIDLLIKPRSVG